MPADIQRLLFTAPSSHEPEALYDATGQLNMGRALAQIHRCYILAQTENGVLLIDQHAAHERMTYEKLKAQLAKADVATQMLLTPESLSLHGEAAAWLHDHAKALQPFGVDIEIAGDESFLVRSIPAMLAGEAVCELVAELVDACMLIGMESEADHRADWGVCWNAGWVTVPARVQSRRGVYCQLMSRMGYCVKWSKRPTSPSAIMAARLMCLFP